MSKEKYRTCSYGNCKRKHHAHGYCSRHYDSVYMPTRNKKKLKSKTCNVCHFAELFLGKEEWRDIKNHEGIYQISSFGRIRSLDRIIRNGTFRRGIILSIHQSQNGYIRTGIIEDDKIKNKLIHRLVMTAFNDSENKEETVNHKDGHKYNNHYKNLEWASWSDQQRHAYDNGLNKATRGAERSDSVQVYTIEKSTGKIVHHGSVHEAFRYTGISKQSLLQWLHGKHSPSDWQKFTVHYEEEQP